MPCAEPAFPEQCLEGVGAGCPWFRSTFKMASWKIGFGWGNDSFFLPGYWPCTLCRGPESAWWWWRRSSHVWRYPCEEKLPVLDFSLSFCALSKANELLCLFSEHVKQKMARDCDAWICGISGTWGLDMGFLCSPTSCAMFNVQYSGSLEPYVIYSLESRASSLSPDLHVHIWKKTWLRFQIVKRLEVETEPGISWHLILRWLNFNCVFPINFWPNFSWNQACCHNFRDEKISWIESNHKLASFCAMTRYELLSEVWKADTASYTESKEEPHEHQWRTFPRNFVSGSCKIWPQRSRGVWKLWLRVSLV